METLSTENDVVKQQKPVPITIVQQSSSVNLTQEEAHIVKDFFNGGIK